MPKTSLARAEPLAFAAMRIVSGVLFLFHGLQKLINWPPGGHPVALASQVGVGGVIELVCGTLIALGWRTRGAAFIASGMMAVAYFQFHWKLAIANVAWAPVVNRGELAVIYCFLFLFIATHGSGIASVDKLLARR
ncbi:MAG TPA: DoxX family protein [Polyangiaceae bacterium]|nr:DoxX family protein [Polyangiaceae bacterium]